jgi:DNA-binding CsgD family transcriptional regulator/Tfp pilus assembly protein PilF
MVSDVQPVGREEETSALHEWLRRAEELPAALLLEGDPGIGKTTLWRGGLDLARALGYGVLTCNPSAAESQLSFAALRDLIDDVFDEAAPHLPAPQRRALDIACLREEPSPTPLDSSAVAAAFLNVLRAVVARGPVLIAVDDAQWLDGPSADLLRFAVRRLGDLQVAVLVTLRTAPDGAVPVGLDRALAGPRLRRVHVGPLTPGALNLLFRRHLNVSFPRPVLRRIHDTSGGNPFFALEIARALDRSARRPGPGEPLPVPGSLHELMRERIDGLSERAQKLLAVVAALSRPTIADVESLSRHGGGREALREAMDAEILSAGDGRVSFAHPLLAACAYSRLGAGERRELHKELASSILQPEERARHLALAAEGPDNEVAAALEEAAGIAFRRGAPSAAAGLSEQARRLTPDSPTGERLERGLAAGRYHFEAGDTEAASAALEEVIAGSPDKSLRADARNSLARIEMLTGRLRSAALRFEETLREQTGAPWIAAEAEEGLAWSLMLMREDIAAAGRHSVAAVQLAEAAGDPDRLSEALACRAFSDALLGRERAHRTMERALSLARPIGSLDLPRVIRHPLFAHAILLAWWDRPEGSLTAFDNLHRRALERGDESSLSRILFGLGYGHLLTGDLPTALRFAQEGRDVALQVGQQPNLGTLLFSVELVEAHLGGSTPPRGLDDHAPARKTILSDMVNRYAQGVAGLAREDPSATHRQLAPLVEQTVEAGIVEPGAMRFFPDEIEALVSLGDHDAAHELLRHFEKAAVQTRRRSALGASQRCRGFLYAAKGDFASAIAAFERALREHERTPMPFERGRTLFHLGIAQRRAGQKRAARASLEEARALFEAVGSAPWVRRAEKEQGRIGGRAPSTGGLTPTERRVAELVAEGRSNNEVAGALFVSVKSVEAHLTRIYAKLGVHSRGALAHHLTRAQTLQDHDAPGGKV